MKSIHQNVLFLKEMHPSNYGARLEPFLRNMEKWVINTARNCALSHLKNILLFKISIKITVENGWGRNHRGIYHAESRPTLTCLNLYKEKGLQVALKVMGTHASNTCLEGMSEISFPFWLWLQMLSPNWGLTSFTCLEYSKIHFPLEDSLHMLTININRIKWLSLRDKYFQVSLLATLIVNC